MSTDADTVREALDYLHERADLYDLSLGVNEPLIETTGQYADGLAALDRLAAAEARAKTLAEAVRNLLEDVDEARIDDPLLHDLEIRIGGRFLGFGGGFNHEDDLRAALAAVTPTEAA